MIIKHTVIPLKMSRAKERVVGAEAVIVGDCAILLLLVFAALRPYSTIKKIVVDRVRAVFGPAVNIYTGV
jgi:hypothetical protein